MPHIFPRDTVVRATFLLPDGTAFVDLGGPTLAQGWGTGSHEELMAVYSVVQTVTTNFPDAKRVRILINDEPRGDAGGTREPVARAAAVGELRGAVARDIEQ